MAEPLNIYTIERSYDQHLNRSTPVDSLTESVGSTDTGANNGSDSGSPTSTNTTSSSNGNVQEQQVKDAGAIGDIWVNTFIRSTNWKPRTQGFTIEGQNGYAEFCNVFVSGNIQALTGLIGGFTIGATNLSATSGGNTTIVSSGSTAFSAGPTGTPTFYVTQAGVLNATGAVITGTLTATSGAIGGWIINATSIAGTGVTLSSSSDAYISFGVTPPALPTAGTGIFINKTGLYGLNANVQNFKIDGTNGYITANAGTVGGCTLATTSIGSTTYVSGPLGSGWNISNAGTAEFQNVSVRGIIRTSVFEKDTISCVNGMVLVSKADVLNSDMTALDASTVTIKGDTTFVANEVIRIKDGVDDEWMLVTNAASAPTYTVTRDLASSYAVNTNPIWKKGTAVVSMGVGTGTKTGFVLLDSSSANSPYIDVYGRNSDTYTDYTIHGRFGWLKGLTDADVGLATTDVWGLYTDNAYIKGVIVANTGYIGGTTGWTIATGYIKKDTGVELTSAGMAPLDYPFYAGAQYANRATAPYRVSNAGVLTATSANITGTINATAGKFGTSTNYWSVGATGLTATSASTDVIINYGKTDFAQDTTAGFILGYDYSATKAKFEIGTTATGLLKYDGSLSVIGGSIYAGLFSTSAGGSTTQRITLDSSTNLLDFYDTNNNKVVTLGTTSFYGLTFNLNDTVSGGINMSSSVAGRGFNYENTGNVASYGFKSNMSGATGNGIGIDITNAGGSSAFGGIFTISNACKGIEIDNTGSNFSFNINHSGNGTLSTFTNSGTNRTHYIRSSNTGATYALQIDHAANSAALYIDKTGVSECVSLHQSVNSTDIISGIKFDLVNIGTGAECAFDFQGDEKINADADGSVDYVIRVRVGTAVRYIRLHNPTGS